MLGLYIQISQRDDIESEPVDQIKTGEILNIFPALRPVAAFLICGKYSFKNWPWENLNQNHWQWEKSKSGPLLVGKSKSLTARKSFSTTGLYTFPDISLTIGFSTRNTKWKTVWSASRKQYFENGVFYPQLFSYFLSVSLN